MSVRIKRQGNNVPNEQPEMTDPVVTETTFDGQTYAWMPGQVRNFADDGVGAGHAAFDNGVENTVKEDAVPFGSSRS